MPKAKSKSKKRKKEVSSSETSDSGTNSDSSEESSEESERDLSGDRSDDESEESDDDPRNRFLTPFLQEKPVKMVVTKWMKNKLRGAFLGTPVGKDEKAAMIDRYYCSPAHFKLFSAPKVSGNFLVLFIFYFY